MVYIGIVFTSLISIVYAQTSSPAIDMSLPPDLQKYYNESGLDSNTNKYMEMFEKKCEKNGHKEAFENMKENTLLFITCMSTLINMENVTKEIEDAKPTGTVDEVFKRYCNKSPLFKKCFHNVVESVRPCFSGNEKNNFKTLYNVTDQLMEFVCFKDGDRIALFIAEGGKECFEEKQDDVRNCLNSTFDEQTQSELQNITDIDSVLNLEFKQKQCDQFSSLQNCIVTVLETCQKPTSANIVESLFKFIRKSTPCKQIDAKAAKPNSATALSITLSTFIVALAVAVYL